MVKYDAETQQTVRSKTEMLGQGKSNFRTVWDESDGAGGDGDGAGGVQDRILAHNAILYIYCINRLSLLHYMTSLQCTLLASYIVQYHLQLTAFHSISPTTTLPKSM